MRIPHLLLSAALLCSVVRGWSADEQVGATRVATWKDDKRAALILMFDDSCATHVKNVIPELVKRKMVGTFYLNPGSGQYAALKNDWEVVIPKLGMEYANHTFTHKGAKDAADLEDELVKCDDAIARTNGGKRPALISFGIPGVKPGAWAVTDQELKDALAKNHLILRPDVNGRFAFIHLKSADALFGIAQKAIAAGSADCVAFHGVGGDWLTTDMPMFLGFLDKLETVRDQLWIAGHIAVHTYQTERESAKASVGQIGAKGIHVTLTTAADPTYYSAPLTLVTRVPAEWTHCSVTQGSSTATGTPSNGVVRYDAKPDGTPIILSPAP